MPRGPNGVGPRRVDERAYERALRRIILTPYMRQLRDGLSRTAAASIALDAINRVFWDRGQTDLLVESEVAAHAARLSGYHKRRLIQTFRTALGIDIRPVLSDVAIQPIMAAWRRENIGLIRTIPERFHEGLYRRVSETFADRPFDQQELSKVLNREFRTSGHNLRRLTRDQTSKAIGQLTRTRHQQLGIEQYRWRTAQDERVRDTHAALDGTVQRWDSPPGVGHPGQDIQCRCVAIPIVGDVVPRAQGQVNETKGEPYREGGRFRNRPPVYRLSTHNADPEARSVSSLREGTRLYTGGGYSSLNRKMRHGLPLDQYERRILNDIVLDVGPLQTDRMTYRGMRGAADWQPGTTETLWSPTSTSMSHAKASETFAGRTMIQLKVPRGTPAVVMKGGPNEMEVLLKPRRKIRILERSRDIEGRDYWVVEVVQ